MAGYWSSPDVTTFLEVFCINQESTLEALQETVCSDVGTPLAELQHQTRVKA